MYLSSFSYFELIVYLLCNLWKIIYDIDSKWKYTSLGIGITLLLGNLWTLLIVIKSF